LTGSHLEHRRFDDERILETPHPFDMKRHRRFVLECQRDLRSLPDGTLQLHHDRYLDDTTNRNLRIEVVDARAATAGYGSLDPQWTTGGVLELESMRDVGGSFGGDPDKPEVVMAITGENRRREPLDRQPDEQTQKQNASEEEKSVQGPAGGHFMLEGIRIDHANR
tara:strand:- start:2835 stop:3332 length:498 start_codon:yes stop_codon:yes gene_type:complete